MTYLSKARQIIIETIKSTWVYKQLRKLVAKPIYLLLIVAVILLSGFHLKNYVNSYIANLKD